MKTLNFSTHSIYRGDLILINSEYPIYDKDNNYGTSLVSVGNEYTDILLDYVAAKKLSQIFIDLNIKDRIIPVSGYRNGKEQNQIYTDSLDENGYGFTNKYVALPGHSEHQTGLAIDLAENKGEFDFIRPLFPYTGLCMQFRRLAIRYGFIERYPRGKEKITGIAHEPWHFRYVGYPHSEIMHLNNFTLEEYLIYLKNYHYKRKHLQFFYSDFNYEIFYVDNTSLSKLLIELPGSISYQISGNNMDGFIITLRKNR